MFINVVFLFCDFVLFEFEDEKMKGSDARHHTGSMCYFLHVSFLPAEQEVPGTRYQTTTTHSNNNQLEEDQDEEEKRKRTKEQNF